MLNFKIFTNLFQANYSFEFKNSCKVKVNWIHSEEINETNVQENFSGLNGVLVNSVLEIEEWKEKYLQ